MHDLSEPAMRLKAATRDLIKHCGGIVRAGEISGYSKSEAGRWGNPGEPSTIPLLAIVRLEADCGVPLVTGVLADLAGHEIAPIDGGRQAATSLMHCQADVMAAAGGVVSTIAGALADGVVTPAEMDLIDRAAAPLTRATAQLRQCAAGGKTAPNLRAVE
jgi:hypothetical protein